MGDNAAINNLTDATAYNGCYWAGANISSKDLANNLIYTGESKWDYGITLNLDSIKEAVERITKERELAKVTPDEGPEIPKWTGFLPI
jgi:hypothetical protein